MTITLLEFPRHGLDIVADHEKADADLESRAHEDDRYRGQDAVQDPYENGVVALYHVDIIAEIDLFRQREGGFAEVARRPQRIEQADVDKERRSRLCRGMPSTSPSPTSSTRAASWRLKR
ncbi:MAG: hypothetical protein NT061_07865 [Spirochaetes bacterium]|nr:hypothetical protein [Spirochaetota bacterium]